MKEYFVFIITISIIIFNNSIWKGQKYGSCARKCPKFTGTRLLDKCFPVNVTIDFKTPLL